MNFTDFIRFQNFAILLFVFTNLIEKATHVTLFWNLARNSEKNHQKFRLKNGKFEVFAIELMKFIDSISIFFGYF